MKRRAPKTRNVLQLCICCVMSIGLWGACAPPVDTINIPAKDFGGGTKEPSVVTPPTTRARPPSGLEMRNENYASIDFFRLAGELRKEGYISTQDESNITSKELIMKLSSGTGWGGEKKPTKPLTDEEKEQAKENKRAFMKLLVMPLMNGLFQKHTKNYNKNTPNHTEMHCGTCHGEGQKLTADTKFDFSTPSKLYPLSRSNPMKTENERQAKVAKFMARVILPVASQLLQRKIDCFHCHAAKP